ncbi:MAG: DUF1841 family protein [Gammaproteobacteria bacterium]|nr:DUF1841 family protein [Gammaproteobacteria bacterium]
MYTDERHRLRQFFGQVLQKLNAKTPLEALEVQVAEVIKLHPEYHAALLDIEKDYLPEMGQTNPFLHLSLHLGIREQVSLDRPQGIREVYQKLLLQRKDPHIVEHEMIEALAEVLHHAQKYGLPPDEARYLALLQSFLKG